MGCHRVDLVTDITAPARPSKPGAIAAKKLRSSHPSNVFLRKVDARTMCLRTRALSVMTQPTASIVPLEANNEILINAFSATMRSRLGRLLRSTPRLIRGMLPV